MSKYLARLKTEKHSPDELPKLPKAHNCQTHELPKLPKAPFDSYDSTSSGHFSEMKGTNPQDLQRLVGEALAVVDTTGRPWPRDFFTNLSESDRQQIKALQHKIDRAVLGGLAEGLPGLLDEWSGMLLASRKRSERTLTKGEIRHE